MGNTEGQEVKWNPRAEWKAERHIPSHLFTRGNHDVTHSTARGTMVAGRKQQVTLGGGEEEGWGGKGGRVEGPEEALFY